MTNHLTHIKAVFFDADDTLWVNEPHYRRTERAFFDLIGLPHERGAEELFRTEMQNLELYGYGAKGFILSMLETAQRVLGPERAADKTAPVLELGKQLLRVPVTLLPGVRETLEKLAPRYMLAVATKGDLLDQERKLKNSGLLPFFKHAEIMSDKTPQAYLDLCRTLHVSPAETLMVGNSVRSDVLPALEAGLSAAHVPCEDGWKHEEVHTDGLSPFPRLQTLADLPGLLNGAENPHA